MIMTDRLDIEFAALKILQELYDSKPEWTWMSMVVEGMIGMPRNGYEWAVRYWIKGAELSVTVQPPDNFEFMDVPNKDFNFDLAAPTVFEDFVATINRWISEQEQR
jgi:hypothetical protein